MGPVLSSRPSAPSAIVLLLGPQPKTVWNGRDVPEFQGFNDADTQAIFDITKAAYGPWLIDVTTDASTTKPHATIGFSNLFGNYPISGGQANENSFNIPGVGAYVFIDQLDHLAWAIGRDAVHEAGHCLGLTHVYDTDGLAPAYWMGNCLIGTPQWTIPQRDTLDATFGPSADLDFDGVVNMQDAQILRTGHYTAAEAIAVARGFGGK